MPAMSLQQKLDSDIKDAMRSRDRVRLDAIRGIKAAVMNAEVQANATLTDAQVEEIIARQVRQRRESIEMFTRGNRPDLVTKEQTELAVLLTYLPQQLSADEVRALVRQAAADVGARGPADKGKVMGKLMPQVKGKAEGKMVNEVVTQVLAELA